MRIGSTAISPRTADGGAMSFAPHRCAIGSRPSRELQEELSRGFKKRVVYWRANPAPQKWLIARPIGRNGPLFGPTDDRLPSGRSFSTIPSRNKYARTLSCDSLFITLPPGRG